jgi:predicted P-loop ATPase
MNPFDFFTHHGLAIAPIAGGQKTPRGFVDDIYSACSRDREQLERWQAEHPGCGWALPMGPNRIVAFDLDNKPDRPNGVVAFPNWCAENALPAYQPAWITASGGGHVLLQLPDNVDPKSLHQPDLCAGINVRAAFHSYVVCPPTVLNGRRYLIIPGATIHDAPAALIAHCTRSTAKTSAVGLGTLDIADVLALMTWLNDRGQFVEYNDWVGAGMALKLEFGPAGLVPWRITHDTTVTPELERTKWQSFDSDPRPGAQTLASWLKRAHDLGWTGTVRKSSAALFAGVPVVVPATTGGIPMLAGRGEKQAELWGPILAKVPVLERTAAHPEMPDNGHPLRAAVNAAIPGIAADPTAHADALAVIEAVHPQTAALVAAITPAVKARAEALRQDAEHALKPANYSRDHKGDIQRDNLDNMRFYLSSLGIAIRWNRWIERVELRGWEWPQWTILSDVLVAKLRMRASQTGTRFLPSKEFTWDALLSLAHDSPVDPACDLLNTLQAQWDGVQRLSGWLTRACGVPFDAYYQAVGATILLGLVARIRCPGVQFQLMPVFVSEAQGTAKSSLARLLALRDEWFVENVALGESAKELVLLLAGKSVAEISEMRTRGEVDAVKAMVSATHDEGRPAYGRATVKRPRRHIFVGTTNRVEFLEDPTGGRRFLPIMVRGEIDLEWVRANIAQLIGEASALQARGADINLPREVWGLAALHQEAATAKSSAATLIEQWFAGSEPAWITSANLILLLRHALGRTPSRGEYAQAMAKLGFVSRTRWDGNNSPRVWVKGEPDRSVPAYGPTLGHDGMPRLQLAETLNLPKPGLTQLPSGLGGSVM